MTCTYVCTGVLTYLSTKVIHRRTLGSLKNLLANISISWSWCTDCVHYMMRRINCVIICASYNLNHQYAKVKNLVVENLNKILNFPFWAVVFLLSHFAKKNDPLDQPKNSTVNHFSSLQDFAFKTYFLGTFMKNV